MLTLCYSFCNFSLDIFQEIARRTLLTGVLIFIPGNVQLAAAILICVTAVASLHYFQPHRNRIVLYVAQVSFLMTTFKYVVAVVLKMETTPATTSNDKELGLLLIGMDVLFAAGCVFCCVAVVVALQISLQHRTNGDGEHLGAADPLVLNSKRPSKWRALDVAKAHELAIVTRTEENAQKAHENAVVQQLANQKRAMDRLKHRLEKRQTNKNNEKNKKKSKSKLNTIPLNLNKKKIRKNQQQ